MRQIVQNHQFWNDPAEYRKGTTQIYSGYWRNSFLVQNLNNMVNDLHQIQQQMDQINPNFTKFLQAVKQHYHNCQLSPAVDLIASIFEKLFNKESLVSVFYEHFGDFFKVYYNNDEVKIRETYSNFKVWVILATNFLETYQFIINKYEFLGSGSFIGKEKRGNETINVYKDGHSDRNSQLLSIGSGTGNVQIHSRLGYHLRFQRQQYAQNQKFI